MPRTARVVVPNCPHHVTQRGNRRCDVFLDAADREQYLDGLAKYAELYGVKVWAYCLMTNHVHLILVPKHAEGLGLLLKQTHQTYATHFNLHTGESGHLWQGRYFSCPLDEDHLWTAVRYVEMNPVRAGLVEAAVGFRWSSAQGHAGLRSDPVLDSTFPPAGAIKDWQTWLHFESTEQEKQLQQCTQSGLVCGSESFIKKIERRLKRKLIPGKRGRPPKTSG
jgi:putative transposase